MASHPAFAAQMGKGRPKGSVNKATKQAKEAIRLAFEGIGGVEAFIEWAKKDENRGAFYTMYTKLLPVEMHHSGSDEPDAKAVLIHFTRQDQPK